MHLGLFLTPRQLPTWAGQEETELSSKFLLLQKLWMIHYLQSGVLLARFWRSPPGSWNNSPLTGKQMMEGMGYMSQAKVMTKWNCGWWEEFQHISKSVPRIGCLSSLGLPHFHPAPPWIYLSLSGLQDPSFRSRAGYLQIHLGQWWWVVRLSLGDTTA